MKEPRAGSAAVMAALYSPNYLLLIQNLLNPDLFWKFIGETSEIGEYPLETLVRGVWEEGGLMLRVLRDLVGTIVELGDNEMIVTPVRPPITIYRKNSFEQYFYKVRMPDARLLDLSGKRFDGADKDEFFETRAFPIMDVPHREDFFPRHMPLFNELLQAA